VGAKSITRLKSKNKDDCVADSLYWPAMPRSMVMKVAENSNTYNPQTQQQEQQPHTVQPYCVPVPQQDEYHLHDCAVHSMWMHFVDFCQATASSDADNTSSLNSEASMCYAAVNVKTNPYTRSDRLPVFRYLGSAPQSGVNAAAGGVGASGSSDASAPRLASLNSNINNSSVIGGGSYSHAHHATHQQQQQLALTALYSHPAPTTAASFSAPHNANSNAAASAAAALQYDLLQQQQRRSLPPSGRPSPSVGPMSGAGLLGGGADFLLSNSAGTNASAIANSTRVSTSFGLDFAAQQQQQQPLGLSNGLQQQQELSFLLQREQERQTAAGFGSYQQQQQQQQQPQNQLLFGLNGSSSLLGSASAGTTTTSSTVGTAAAGGGGPLRRHSSLSPVSVTEDAAVLSGPVGSSSNHSNSDCDFGATGAGAGAGFLNNGAFASDLEGDETDTGCSSNSSGFTYAAVAAASAAAALVDGDNHFMRRMQ
jgi:hypothetical protein